MRLFPVRSLFVVLLCVLAASAPTAEPAAAPEAGWLARLNFYRATALLPPVVEDSTLSGAVRRHAQYMVVHGVVKHSEDRYDSWATAEGAAAAAFSNLAGSTRATETDSWAVDLWMQAPFRALGMLDPALTRVGFGIQRAPGHGKVQTAAGARRHPRAQPLAVSGRVSHRLAGARRDGADRGAHVGISEPAQQLSGIRRAGGAAADRPDWRG